MAANAVRCSGVATMCGPPRKNNFEAPPERIAIQKQWRGNDFHTGGLKKFQGGIEPPCPPPLPALLYESIDE